MSYAKLSKQIAQIMNLAKDRAEALVAERLRSEMHAFAAKLKPSTELRYVDGMGTRFFCIVCANGRKLYINLEDHYYDEFPGFYPGPRSTAFVQPLNDLLVFANQMDNDHRLSFGDHRVRGTRRR